MVNFTGEELSALMGGALPLAEYEAYAAPFSSAMHQAGCDDVHSQAMWCAQLGHETGGLRWLRELWGPTPDQRSYEGRRDLGNTQPGDGFRFRGRGAIQITGRSNYTRFSQWAFDHNEATTPIFFVENPETLCEPRYAFLPAVWYWTIARPELGRLAANGDVTNVTKLINGGLNGVDDRRDRYRRCLDLIRSVTNITPLKGGMNVSEKVLKYSRHAVAQDTFFNCGPASVQTITLAATGNLIDESALGRALGTHRGGTDYIGQFPKVLNASIPGSAYRHVDLPGYPDHAGKDRLWSHICRSIDAGHGVVANIVAPPSNYPRGVKGSVSPAYRGGTVYHYIAIMGYCDDPHSGRCVWVADSGFSPFGYWLSLDQLATLIPPKGYAFSDSDPLPENVHESEVILFGKDQVQALHEVKLGVAALNEKLDRYHNEFVESLINPRARFTVVNLIRVIDATCWSTFQLVKAIAKKHGIDPDEYVRDAVTEDRNK